MKVAELVEDFDLYPRHDVDSQHVGYLTQAIQAGAQMPPLVAWKDGNRIIDGFHRGRALRRVYGDDAESDVLIKSYPTAKEAFLDAMQFNSSHGRTLTTFDRAHCAIKAANLGIDDSMIAQALHVDPAYIGGLRVDRSAKDQGGLYVPIKRTIRHMAGKRLTKSQQAANEKLSGMNQRFYVNQLLTLIESGMLDTSDEELMQAMGKLVEKIGEVIGAATAA